MSKSILLTRPRMASDRWAVLLAEQGLGSVIEPLLTISPTYAAQPQGPFEAVLVTSANAPDILEGLTQSLSELFSLPCFCVGSSTGEAARRLGFKNVRSTASDSLATAQSIVSTLPKGEARVLHISGDVVDPKAKEYLSRHSITLEQWAVYRATASEDFTPQVKRLFESSEISAIPVFSPRTAQILVSLIEQNRLGKLCHGIVAVGLSQAVADVLQTVPWRKLIVPTAPSEEAVLASLHSELLMIDPTSETVAERPQEMPSPTPSPVRQKTFKWKAITVLILLAAGGAWWVQHQAGQRLAPTIVVPSAELSLEQRVEALEKQLSAMTEIAQAAPTAASESSDLQDQVKALESRITQVENTGAQSGEAARKWASLVLAYIDLRDAARTGKMFGRELEDMRKSSEGNASVTQDLSELEILDSAPVPSYTELLTEIDAQEPGITLPDSIETDLTWWGKLRSAFRPLISVHPLHPAQFVALDQALASGDGARAQEEFMTLPDAAQRQLEVFQGKLGRRVKLDLVLEDLKGHLTETPKVVP